MNLSKVLIALPALIVAVPELGAEVKSLQADQALVAALKNAPLLSARVTLISKEWRQVEQDVEAIKKSNIFTLFSSVPKLLADAGVLKADVTNAQANTALVAEIEANPLLKAHLVAISDEWAAVETAIKAIQ